MRLAFETERPVSIFYDTIDWPLLCSWMVAACGLQSIANPLVAVRNCSRFDLSDFNTLLSNAEGPADRRWHF